MSAVLREAVHVGIRGAKGGDASASTPTEAPDSLHSIAYARILDLVSEGEIQGFAHPANPLQDIFLDSTPLANADGTLNFQNVQVDSRSGTQTQTVLTGFPDVENETAVNLELKSTVDWTQAINDLALNAVRVMLSVPALSQSNASTGDITGYSIQYEIELSTDGGSYQTMLTSAFTGKTTSKYERSHRIDLPAATSGWTLRVHRITANQNLATVADTMMVESYTEIVDARFSYPNSAVIGLIIDSQQFSSIPQRAYNLLGRIVSVPSNYNPTTRVYTGAWDGSFKPAWTNNPAWIFYDLATNARYGLGQYITAAQVNKWNLYQIAQYCDGLVNDGMGGQEPRFTCTLYLQQQADAYKVLQDLATVFRGISFWGAGQINAVADMPSDPVYTYTAANVLGGKFTYQGSGKKTRFTVALVSWNDPTDLGRAKVEYVPDREGIARYGINITQVTATGATSRGQAQRVGLWTLLTSRLETETTSFGVGLDGTIAAPGQVVRIADPARAGKRQAGRIHSATATAITVDAAPTVAVGDSLTCTLPAGVTETHTVTGVAGSVISVAAPGFSAVPQVEAVWVTESATLTAATFRVVSVVEDQAAPALGFTLTALAHNASKFAAIDFGAPIVIPPITAIPPSVQPAPATVTLEAFPTFGQVLTQTTLTIQWDATPDAVYYHVEWRKDSGDWQVMPIQRGLSVDVHVWPGSYLARVAAVNASGIGSVATASNTYVVVDQTQASQRVEALSEEVADAQSEAAAASAQLADIASDNILSPAEKPTVMRDYAVITTEQAGIDAQADAYGVSRTAYDSAIAALTTYLGTLTTPTAWNDKSGNTTIVGATFRANFNTVYTTRQALLNAIYAAAKALANAAQGTANTANSTANTANAAAGQALDQIGNLANSQYLQNPFFTTGDLSGWTSDHGSWAYQSGSNGPASGDSQYAIHVGSSANPTDSLRNAGKVPVYAGAVLKAQCAVNGSGSPNGSCGVRISWRNSADSEIGFAATTAPSTTNGETDTFAIGTAPAAAVYAHIECAAYNHTTGAYACDNFAAWALADTLDQVPDSATRFAAAEAGADKTAGKSIDVLTDGVSYTRAVQTSTSEVVPNGNFALGPDVQGNIPGWTPLNASLLQFATGGYNGGPVLRLTGSVNYGQVETGKIYTCTTGDVFALTAAVAASSGTTAYAQLVFYGPTGASLGGGAVIGSSSPTYNYATAQAQAPSGAARLGIILNSSVAGVNAWFGNIALARVRTQNGIMPITWGGVRSVLSGSPISYSISGTTVNFSVTAFTNYNGGMNPSYSASSGSVTQAAGSTKIWYLYFRDPISAGGAQTLHMTGNVSDLAQYPDIVNIGNASVTVAAGGGGSSGGGSGGGGFCVCRDMWIDRGTQANDAMLGYPFDCCDFKTSGTATFKRPMLAVEYEVTECVRLTTERGAVLDCGVTTPFDTIDGREKRAPQMLGELVLTDAGLEQIVSVEPIGIRPVCFFHFGGISYAAGCDPSHRIYSHNGTPSKP